MVDQNHGMWAQENTGTSGAWTTLISVPLSFEYVGTIRATMISTAAGASTSFDISVNNSTAGSSTTAADYLTYYDEIYQGDPPRDYTVSVTAGQKIHVRARDSVTFSFHAMKKDLSS